MFDCQCFTRAGHHLTLMMNFGNLAKPELFCLTGQFRYFPLADGKFKQADKKDFCVFNPKEWLDFPKSQEGFPYAMKVPLVA